MNRIIFPNFNDHGNLIHRTSPLAAWVETTTDLARIISSAEHHPLVPILNYSSASNRAGVLCQLGNLRRSLIGNTVKVLLIETLIRALQFIISLAKNYEAEKNNYEEAKFILVSSQTDYQTAEDARAKSEHAGTRNVPALLAAQECCPSGCCCSVL
jgi:hypothetical protein